MTDFESIQNNVNQIIKHLGSVDVVVNNAGKIVFPAGAVYCGTKFAIRAISAGLRMEMAMENKNVRVTDIQPGAAATELSTTITDPDALAMFSNWENIDFLQADDIARAVSYAISQPDTVSVNELTVRPTNQPT